MKKWLRDLNDKQKLFLMFAILFVYFIFIGFVVACDSRNFIRYKNLIEDRNTIRLPTKNLLH